MPSTWPRRLGDAPRRRRGPRRRSPGPESSIAVERQRAQSSSCVPASSTRPWSTTTMRSASDSDDRRCAMRIVVRSCAIRRSVAWISSSTRRVDRRGRVVEQQDLRVGEQRAGERDPLALTARQREALLADDRVVAVGEPQDELVRLGRRAPRPRSPRRSRRAGRRRCWRVIVSEKRNESSNTTPMLRRSESSVTSRTSTPSMVIAPGVHVVEAGEQQRDRRLARTRAADERDRLAGRDREVEVAQHRLGRRVAERHVLERTSPRGTARSTASGCVLHERRGVEQVVDALGARRGRAGRP